MLSGGGGLNGTNDADMRLYYDQVRQRQIKDMYAGMTAIYRLVAASKQVQLPADFAIEFRSLWELSDTDKASIAGQITTAVGGAMDSGIIGQKTGLKELKQSSRRTGVFTNITDEMITEAENEEPPEPELETPNVLGLPSPPPNGPEGNKPPVPPGEEG